MANNQKFQEIKIEWEGEEKTIPASRVMRTIADVEDHVTLKELVEYSSNPGGAKFGKLAYGYAALLQSAGFQVVPENIYAEMLQMKEQDSSVLFAAVHGLLALMTPPSSLAKKMDTGKKSEEDEAGGRPVRKNRQPTAAK